MSSRMENYYQLWSEDIWSLFILKIDLAENVFNFVEQTLEN